MNKITIEKLRRDMNFKVRLTYRRFVDNALETLYEIRERNLQHKINAKGGELLLEATLPDGKEYSSVAKCSRDDIFNKFVARQIVIGRLMKQVGGMPAENVIQLNTVS